MEGGKARCLLCLTQMSRKSDLITNILKEDMLFFRREILVLKPFGQYTPVFVRRTIGNLSDPGTDIYEVFQDDGKTGTFVEDSEIKRTIEEGFVTPAYRYRAMEFMTRNVYGTTYENMLKHIVEFDQPDGVRDVSSEKIYDPFDDLFEAIERKFVSARVCYINKRAIEFLTITKTADMWLMDYDPKSWKRLVVRINRVNTEANKKAARAMMI